MASSSSSSSSSFVVPPPKYDVFLSFRGKDTRCNFTDHLHRALCQKQIHTFIDNKLKKGHPISPELLKAIEESKISVIIFSKSYASSKWCLNELEKILECKRLYGRLVIPIFHHVTPSEVRYQTGSFEDAFVKHERRFKEDPEKVQRWRDALNEASHLSGWDSSSIRMESELVDAAVKDILKKLTDLSSPCKYPVGMDSRIEEIKSLLSIGSPDVRVIGIWGMGGIGKTTLAETIYGLFSGYFEGRCFSSNVREEAENGRLFQLRDRLLCEILEEENLQIQTSQIPQFVQDRVQRKKIFVVLDDVNDFEQIEILTGGLNRFGLGSRIIITTRDKQVLRSLGVDRKYIYELKNLDYREALQLFYIYAFKQSHPPEDFVELSDSVVNYAKGNPLALKVLGSSLCGNSKEVWESAVFNLKMIGDPKIHDVLKISFDTLRSEEKEIFLDIACFFKGRKRDEIISILDSCQLSSNVCLTRLLDKSLISVSNSKILGMHDLFQDMGREIVRRESLNEPGKRSRLWTHEEVYEVLHNSKGTASTQGIFLDMSRKKAINLPRNAFSHMDNLRVLNIQDNKCYEEFGGISSLHLPKGLEDLHHTLTSLAWDGYPLKALPSKFRPEKLVELKLPYSNIEKIWKRPKRAIGLKWIDLNHSSRLIEIPDLSEVPNLEDLNLEHCTSLTEVTPSIQCPKNLRRLRLRGCASLESFPSDIHFISLITLDLSDCISLTKFPRISGSVKELYLPGTAIAEVGKSIARLPELVLLSLANCKSLRTISTRICKLKSLTRLDLRNCSQLARFPKILEKMECLEILWLTGATKIEELPSSIDNLIGLRLLDVGLCKNLQKLPDSICNVASLVEIHLPYCSELQTLPENLGNLTCLEKLDAKGTAVSQLPSSIIGCKKISYLDLSSCNLSAVPEGLGCLSTLEELYLSRNNMGSLTTSIKLLSKLKRLYLSDCDLLQSLPELPLRIQRLVVINCKRFKSLPELPSVVKELVESEVAIATLCHGNGNTIDFIFTNCLKLNQATPSNIDADLRRRIQYMATTSVRLCYEKVYGETPAVSICLPGSAIPNWFKNHNPGSSLTIKVPQHWRDGRCIGFALCAVVAFEGSCYGDGLQLSCDYSFQVNNVVRGSFSCQLTVTNRGYKVLIESDHLVLGYSPCMDAKMFEGDNTIVSFEFSPIYFCSQPPQTCCKVVCCGVHPIFARPNVNQHNFGCNYGQQREVLVEEYPTVSKRFYYSYDHASTSGSGNGSGRYEIVEPHSKRIYRRFDEDKVEGHRKRICKRFDEDTS